MGDSSYNRTGMLVTAGEIDYTWTLQQESNVSGVHGNHLLFLLYFISNIPSGQEID